MNALCCTYEWIMSHMWRSCRTYEWIMFHIWMHHVAHVNESIRTWEGVVVHMNASCCTYEWINSHMWRSRHTYVLIIFSFFEGVPLPSGSWLFNIVHGKHLLGGVPFDQYEWIKSHMWRSRRTYDLVIFSYSTPTLSRQAWQHVWMSHVTYMNESCRTYEWFISCIWISRVGVSKKKSKTETPVLSFRHSLLKCGFLLTQHIATLTATHTQHTAAHLQRCMCFIFIFFLFASIHCNTHCNTHAATHTATHTATGPTKMYVLFTSNAHTVFVCPDCSSMQHTHCNIHCNTHTATYTATYTATQPKRCKCDLPRRLTLFWYDLTPPQCNT